MVKRSVVFLLILIFAERIHSLLNSNCVTPNGEEASCISIFACTVITNALACNDINAISFAQKSQCGYEKVPLVCCGSTGRLILPDVLSIFSTPQLEEPPVVSEDFLTNLVLNKTLCGLEKEADRILGGKITQMFEFPWMVGLEYKSKREDVSAGIRCGGSLINTRYVITAAHCMDTIEFELIRVWLGDWKISSDPDCFNQTLAEVCNDPVVKLHVVRKIPHPFYHDGLNDIALIKLERETLFTDFIRPICLPPPNLPHPRTGSRLTVTGWGTTKEWGYISDVKLKVEVPVISNIECKIVSKRRLIGDSHLCAGGEFGKDSCSGDSGGPLMRKYMDAESNQLQWYLEGIVSWGDGCGRIGIPGVYTRTASYIYWVTYVISEEEITSDFDYDSARESLLPQMTICGLEKKVNESMEDVGKVTKIYEFPWIARLEYGIEENNRTFVCGGSLITNRYVLTAASCLNNIKFEFIRVWLGDWRYSSDPDCETLTTTGRKLCNDAVQKLKLSKPIIYPYHTTFGINDVALLKLEQKVTFTDYIRPICLPPSNSWNTPNESRLVTSGWGVASEFRNISDYKVKLEKILVPNSDCIELYRKQYYNRDEFLRHSTLCAKGLSAKHLCNGGGGSPLMKEYEDGQWFQVGINSMGLGCGVSEKPTVYTKVYRFINWIVRTIAEEGKSHDL